MLTPRIRRTIGRIGYLLPALTLLAFAAQGQEAFKKIKESGVITVGHREASFGFSYVGAGSTPVGYSIDICNRIIDEIKATQKISKLEIKYQSVTSQNRMPLVVNGTVDLECGSTTNLVERQSQVAFSPDIFRYNVRMAVRADSGIKSIADLNGKTVAATTGTTTVRLLRAHEKANGIDFKEVFGKDHAESFLLVESGRAVAFALDDILLAGTIANSKSPKDFMIVGESLRTENQSLMFRKDDPELKALVDRVVSSMMKSGEMERLYNKWFMAPIPPKNVTINYPLNAETRDAFVNPSSKGI
jgi:ABC-type amino acid transport substrate-binding protein